MSTNENYSICSVWRAPIAPKDYKLPENFALDDKAKEVTKRTDFLFHRRLSDLFHAKIITNKTANAVVLTTAAALFPVTLVILAIVTPILLTGLRWISKNQVNGELAKRRLNIINDSIKKWNDGSGGEHIIAAIKHDINESKLFSEKFKRRLSMIPNAHQTLVHILSKEIRSKQSSKESWDRVKSGNVFRNRPELPTNHRENIISLFRKDLQNESVMSPTEVKVGERSINATYKFNLDCIMRKHEDSTIVMPDGKQEIVKCNNDAEKISDSGKVLLLRLSEFAEAVAGECKLDKRQAANLLKYILTSFTQIRSDFVGALLNGGEAGFADTNTIKSPITIKFDKVNKTVDIIYDFTAQFIRPVWVNSTNQNSNPFLNFKIGTAFNVESLKDNNGLDLSDNQFDIGYESFKFIDKPSNDHKAGSSTSSPGLSGDSDNAEKMKRTDSNSSSGSPSPSETRKVENNMDGSPINQNEQD